MKVLCLLSVLGAAAALPSRLSPMQATSHLVAGGPHDALLLRDGAGAYENPCVRLFLQYWGHAMPSSALHRRRTARGYIGTGTAAPPHRRAA